MRTRNKWLLVAAAASLLLATVAYAQSAQFVRKFKGQIFVSDQEFQVVDDDAGMAAQIKKNSKKEIEGKGGEEGKVWDFYWIAVLNKKPGTPNATLFFYEGTGKNRKQATYKDIGIDANQVVVVSDLSISEDDGLKKDTKYEIVLATTAGGKQVVLAKGSALFK